VLARLVEHALDLLTRVRHKGAVVAANARDAYSPPIVGMGRLVGLQVIVVVVVLVKEKEERERKKEKEN